MFRTNNTEIQWSKIRFKEERGGHIGVETKCFV